MRLQYNRFPGYVRFYYSLFMAVIFIKFLFNAPGVGGCMLKANRNVQVYIYTRKSIRA